MKLTQIDLAEGRGGSQREMPASEAVARAEEACGGTLLLFEPDGVPRAAAYSLASQMLAGTAKLQLETGAHPGAMKDAVCSPGGTTIIGVAALERKGFRSAVIDAIDAIETRSR